MQDGADAAAAARRRVRERRNVPPRPADVGEDRVQREPGARRDGGVGVVCDAAGHAEVVGGGLPVGNGEVPGGEVRGGWRPRGDCQVDAGAVGEGDGGHGAGELGEEVAVLVEEAGEGAGDAGYVGVGGGEVGGGGAGLGEADDGGLVGGEGDGDGGVGGGGGVVQDGEDGAGPGVEGVWGGVFDGEVDAQGLGVRAVVVEEDVGEVVLFPPE